MAPKGPTLLLLTEELTRKLVRVLDGHGVLTYWVTEEEAEKLAELWDVEAWIRVVSPLGLNCAACVVPRHL